MSKNIEKLDKPPSPRVEGLVQKCKIYAGLPAIGSKTEQQHYQQLNYDKALINQLKSFGHSKSKSAPYLDIVPLEYVNLRSDKRYLYKTNVSISVNDEVVHGLTRDFSVMGLQLECKQQVKLKKRRHCFTLVS